MAKIVRSFVVGLEDIAAILMSSTNPIEVESVGDLFRVTIQEDK